MQAEACKWHQVGLSLLNYQDDARSNKHNYNRPFNDYKIIHTKGHLTNLSICTDILPELSQLADPLRQFLMSYQIRIYREKKTR